MLEPYFPNGHIDHLRCKCLWGRDGVITAEAYEKMRKEDEQRMQKRLENLSCERNSRSWTQPSRPPSSRRRRRHLARLRLYLRENFPHKQRLPRR